MDESDYYSFACTVASAFSKCAQNATFERALLFHPFRLEQIIKERNVDRDNGKLNHGIDNFKGPLPSVSLDNIVNGDEEEQRLFLEQEERARRRLLQLMDIVFSKLKQKKILVDDAKHNIYR